MPVLASALKDTLVVLSLKRNSIGDLGAESLTQLTRLQRLDLTQNRITAAGAAAIGKISTLRHLNMSGNKIKDEGCGHLAALPSLQSLNTIDVHETPAGLQSLTRLAPTLQQLTLTTSPENDDMSASLAQLTNLTFLQWRAATVLCGLVFDDVEGMSLTTTTALSSLKQLQHLSLSGHILLGVGSDALAGLAGLTQLTYLDLYYVELPTQGLQYLTRMPSLRELTIRVDGWGPAYAPFTSLTSVTKLEVDTFSHGVLGAAYVGALTNLGHLSLHGSDLELADCVGSLTGLTHLDFLNLFDIIVGDLPSHELRRLTNLQSLTLRGVGAGAGGAAEVANLTKLTHLDIGDNNLGDEGAAWVAKLTNLTSLNIGDNAIGAAGAVELAQLTKLTYLSIGGNDLGTEGVEVLTRCLRKLQDSYGLNENST